MIQIERTAWHFRLLKWIGWCPKDNLCPYVRQVFWAIMVMTFTSFISFIFAGLVFYITGSTVGWLLAMLTTGVYLYPDPFALTGTTFGSLIIFIGACVYVKKAVLHWWERFAYSQQYTEESTPPSKPWLLVEWIKAKHDKICPPLEFEDSCN